MPRFLFFTLFYCLVYFSAWKFLYSFNHFPDYFPSLSSSPPRLHPLVFSLIYPLRRSILTPSPFLHPSLSPSATFPYDHRSIQLLLDPPWSIQSRLVSKITFHAKSGGDLPRSLTLPPSSSPNNPLKSFLPRKEPVKTKIVTYRRFTVAR